MLKIKKKIVLNSKMFSTSNISLKLKKIVLKLKKNLNILNKDLTNKKKILNFIRFSAHLLF